MLRIHLPLSLGGRRRVRSLAAALLAGVCLLALLPAAGAGAAARAPGAETGLVELVTLSNRADLISAGNALVGVRLPDGVRPSEVRVWLGDREITDVFALRPNGRVDGLVDGLTVGENLLTARVPDGRGARLIITNHPNGGPVFSGPQVQPWVCQPGAIDEQCNQPPSHELVYKPTNPLANGFQPYDPDNPPSDVAVTTTDEGVTVPFIVRVETGYADRDQYKIALLYQPGQEWDRWLPQEQWNHKLLMTHGGGCGVAYRAGEAPDVLADGVSVSNLAGQAPIGPVDELAGMDSVPTALGRGFATMSTALNNNGHNCNIVTQAESMVMAKEHLIETYGDLRYTIGTGCSGGSLTQHQVANAYPGIYQGLLTTCSFPDSWSSAAQVADYKLVNSYFLDPSKWAPGVLWTERDWAAVLGHVSPVNAIASVEGYFYAFDPVHPCPGVTDQQRYHPEDNPGGVRCGVPDYMINVLGPRAEGVWSPQEQEIGRGFAGIALGNVGVQYGLDLLTGGRITPAQFVDLNAEIGGLDIDIQPIAERAVADRPALANAYRSGAINEANNLDQVAIIDLRGPDPGAAHDAYRAWTVRARIEREHGRFDNHVIWFGHTPLIGDTAYMKEALLAMDRWLTAVEADHSDTLPADKLVANKPADVRDRCSQIPGVERVELPGAGVVCEHKEVQTRYGTPRTVAGEAITTDANQCQLKPLRRSDYYPVLFSHEQWERLRQTFPSGVCDYHKPGLDQQDTIAWQTYANPDGTVHYGGRPLGPAPRSVKFSGP
ncbi:MAG: DUF6351 family protein [Haloechinothrix sp.]